MSSPILERRRWKLHAHGQHIVVKRGMNERFVHPLMKALIWALYLPEYPDATIEVRIGDKYKPDVIAFSRNASIYEAQPDPRFWGEAGRVGRDKIRSLVRRYPDTHFCIGKWDARLTPYEEILHDALDGVRRNAPFDLISFPPESAAHVDDDGAIHITFEDVRWLRL